MNFNPVALFLVVLAGVVLFLLISNRMDKFLNQVSGKTSPPPPKAKGKP